METEPMKKVFVFLGVMALSLTALSARAADDKTALSNRIEDARTVLTQIMATPDQAIPNFIMQNAKCVGVVPSVKKGAFVVGGEYGQGVVTCRTDHGWSAPAFVRI